MKKIICMLLAMMLCCSFLAACGGEDAQETTPADTKATETQVVEMEETEAASEAEETEMETEAATETQETEPETEVTTVPPTEHATEAPDEPVNIPAETANMGSNELPAIE